MSAQADKDVMRVKPKLMGEKRCGSIIKVGRSSFCRSSTIAILAVSPKGIPSLSKEITMAASPFSVAAPLVTPAPSVNHSAATQPAPPPVANQTQPPASQQAPQDTVALTSLPIAKSLSMSDRILAQIDQETARVTAGAQPVKGPQTAATANPGQESAPKNPVPAPYRSSHPQDRDNPDPQKTTANNGLIPMQVMQGKAKALELSGLTTEEIATELHLDLKTVEEYLGNSSQSSAAAPANS